MKASTLVIATLAVWRVTHLISAEDGPVDILVRLRRLAGNSTVGRLMDCFYCLSLWVAAPIAFILTTPWLDRVLLWLALSGGAILAERIAAGRQSAPRAIWREELPENTS